MLLVQTYLSENTAGVYSFTFNNAGALNVNSGDIVLNQPGSFGGSFTIAPGSVIFGSIGMNFTGTEFLQ